MRDKITGFSLIEFSIVLLIIGLLISGTLAGRHISHQAKLSDLAKGINKYLVAINSFKEFYGKYPGDYDEHYVFKLNIIGIVEEPDFISF